MVTIGHNSNPGLVHVRPVLEDLSDTALVIDADILANEISANSHASFNKRPATHQTLGAPVDM